MNEKSKSPFSGVLPKVVLAVVLVVGALVVLSGLLLKVDKDITSQARTGGVTTGRLFSSLPEYEYIQSHSVKNALPAIVVASGFQALTEYGYIRAHSSPSILAEAAYLPVGMRSLTEFGYLAAHNQKDTSVNSLALAASLPVGLRSLTEYGYIAAHSQNNAQSAVAGIPFGMCPLTEFGYIQMHDAAGQ